MGLTSSKARMKRVHLRLPSIKLTKRFKLIPAPTTLHRQYKNTDMQIPRLLKVNGTSPTFIPKTTNQTYYWANNLYHNSRRPENSQISTPMIFHFVHVGYLNASAQWIIYRHLLKGWWLNIGYCFNVVIFWTAWVKLWTTLQMTTPSHCRHKYEWISENSQSLPLTHIIFQTLVQLTGRQYKNKC